MHSCLGHFSLLKGWGRAVPRETGTSARRVENYYLGCEIIYGEEWYSKNGKRYLRQAESSAIRFLIIAEAFKRMAASHVHTRLPVCIPKINCRSVRLRSAREPLSRFSHSFECGAVRFLLWWLFLHLRLRSDNVSSTCVKLFAPFSGSCLKGATRFYPRGSRRPLSLPLAKPFGFD